jgi:hypothetical protein
MLCGHSVSESGLERIDFPSVYTGSRYVIYESQQPIAMHSNPDAKPGVAALLSLILPWAYPQYGTIHFGIVYQ